MEVILLERVAKLGQMGETVNVKPGYARNFLLARGKAQRGLIGLGILVDGADAATGYLAMQDGSVTRKTAMTLIGPAVGAMASGALGLFKR